MRASHTKPISGQGCKPYRQRHAGAASKNRTKRADVDHGWQHGDGAASASPLHSTTARIALPPR